jgi:hypothetical protein
MRCSPFQFAAGLLDRIDARLLPQKQPLLFLFYIIRSPLRSLLSITPVNPPSEGNWLERLLQKAIERKEILADIENKLRDGTLSPSAALSIICPDVPLPPVDDTADALSPPPQVCLAAFTNDSF